MTTPLSFSDDLVGFWAERHLCTVTTLRPDGTPHVVPMGVVLDAEGGAAWAITSRHSRKVRNIEAAGEEGALAAVCQVDGRRWSTLEGRVRVRAGEDDPPCLVCGGILKSDTISFGQALVPEVIERAMVASAEADVLLAVGSTLSVFPAANCVPVARDAGATVVILNAQPTAMDRLADVLLTGQIG